MAAEKEDHYHQTTALATQSAAGSMRWNGGLLCCAFFNNRLHCLLGAEYRDDSQHKLRKRERQEATHCVGDDVLQLSIPGGRHQRGETTALETVVREFWEETARIVDRRALFDALMRDGFGFDFPRSRYHLATLVLYGAKPAADGGGGGIDWHIVERFERHIAERGGAYPSECSSVHLHWVPWSDICRAGDDAVTLDLVSQALEPRTLRAPLSFWARQALVQDRRVRAHLDRLETRLQRGEE